MKNTLQLLLLSITIVHGIWASNEDLQKSQKAYRKLGRILASLPFMQTAYDGEMKYVRCADAYRNSRKARIIDTCNIESCPSTFIQGCTAQLLESPNEIYNLLNQIDPTNYDLHELLPLFSVSVEPLLYHITIIGNNGNTKTEYCSEKPTHAEFVRIATDL